MKLDGNKAIGFIKIGIKKLFFWNEMNKIKELKPLCLLDFYVNEEYQRNGFGKVIEYFKCFNFSLFLFLSLLINDHFSNYSKQ